MLVQRLGCGYGIDPLSLSSSFKPDRRIHAHWIVPCPRKGRAGGGRGAAALRDKKRGGVMVEKNERHMSHACSRRDVGVSMSTKRVEFHVCSEEKERCVCWAYVSMHPWTGGHVYTQHAFLP